MWVFSSGLGGTWEADQGTMLNQVFLHFLNVEALGVMYCRIVLDHGRDLSTLFFKELRCPIADCTKALNDKGLVFDPNGEIAAFSE